MKRRGWLVAAAVVIVANAIALSGAAWNRTGQPRATVVLTERELALASTDPEDSGIALRLDSKLDDAESWLNEEKLEALGFDCSIPTTAETAQQHFARQIARQAWAVLEYDGPAYRKWVARRDQEIEELEATAPNPEQVEERRRTLEDQKLTSSRLFVVDAGIDPASLRERYPDRRRFIILPAVIDIRFPAIPTDAGNGEPVRPRGNIRVLTRQIHVSLPHVSFFDELTSTPVPRYRVTLNVGRRYEPWVVAVEPIDDSAVGD
jgi:hypothetical protein